MLYKRTGGGFTIIELLIAMFVIASVITGVFGLFVLNLRLAGEAERRVVAVALANERMESIRNLPYDEVGTVNGVPSGSIPQEEAVVRNGMTYTVRTDIRYIDDPYDGTAPQSGQCVPLAHRPPGQPGNCQDLCVDPQSANAHLAHGDSISEHCDGTPVTGPDVLNTDYKQARIEVVWSSNVPSRAIVMLTHVVPAGVEGGTATGTLDFLALDADGVGVSGATVHVVNGEVTPAVDITTFTNSEGRVVLPGLAEAADSYEVSVSKAGLTSEQTYDTSATFVPSSDYSHLTLLAGQVTSKTFPIDEAASLTMHTDDPAGVNIGNVAFQLRGNKLIGADEQGDPVFRVDVAGTTNGSGDNTQTGLVWDSYHLTINGVTTGYDIKQTNIPLPAVINPGASVDLIVTLVPHQNYSVHTTVLDGAGAPVSNATVQLTGTGYDVTLTTGPEGQVYFPSDPAVLLPGAGEYTVQVTSTGFQAFTSTVTVSGTTHFTAQLTPSF